ncbi:MAG TPA: cytochrome P450 [Nitriliruptorales bacterium]|nr:cytochrome P450 [Nitriliruptorales bacterium]
MVEGLPLLGNILDFRRDHVEVFRRGYEQHGRIFGIRLGPQRGVVLIGPEHHEFFFRQVDDRLSVPEVYRFVIPMFGEVLTAVTDLETRRAHIALMQSAFQGRRLERYGEVMADEVDAWCERLGSRGTFELWDELEPLSMRIAARTLLGPEVRRRIDEFRPLLGDLARGMEFVLPPNLPLPRFRRRDRARRALAEMIRPIIEARRRSPGRHEDYLQTLVDAPELTDTTDGDDLLVGMALCTLFTGYITTAAQTAWSVVLLLQHPEYQRRVEAEILEQRAASGTAEVRLRSLDLALTETVRLRPVMSHYARMTAEDYIIDGYRIPRGWLTMLCPAVAHRLPDVFDDPDRYDPDRFAPGRDEHMRHPHALIGFSAGFYRCPGSAFGLGEMRTIVARLLDRFHVTLGTPEPGTAFDLGVVRPRAPCLVHYRRRDTSSPVGRRGDRTAVG